MRQRPGSNWEIARIQHLDTSILLAIERRDNWAGRPGFTPQIEWDSWIIEPETQMVLMGRGKYDIRAISWRN